MLTRGLPVPHLHGLEPFFFEIRGTLRRNALLPFAPCACWMAYACASNWPLLLRNALPNLRIEMCLLIYRETSGSKRRGRFGKGFNMQHATDMSAEPPYQCGVTLAALLVIGSSVAARRAAYLLNYEELLPLAQGPFNLRGHGPSLSKDLSKETMRGLCIKPWGF